MRKIILSVIICFLAFAASSQDQFGIRAGISFSNRDGSISNSTDLISLQGSAFGMIRVSPFIFFQPSIGYHPKGNKYRNQSFTDQLGNNTGYGDANFRFDNIELALPFQYLVSGNKDSKLLLGLGPYISYSISGVVKWKHVTAPGNGPSNSKINFSGSGPKRVDAGVNLLITYQVNKHWTLNLDYDRGIVNNNTSAYYQQSKSYSHGEGITVGYLFSSLHRQKTNSNYSSQ